MGHRGQCQASGSAGHAQNGWLLYHHGEHQKGLQHFTRHTLDYLCSPLSPMNPSGSESLPTCFSWSHTAPKWQR